MGPRSEVITEKNVSGRLPRKLKGRSARIPDSSVFADYSDEYLRKFIEVLAPIYVKN